MTRSIPANACCAPGAVAQGRDQAQSHATLATQEAATGSAVPSPSSAQQTGMYQGACTHTRSKLERLAPRPARSEYVGFWLIHGHVTRTVISHMGGSTHSGASLHSPDFKHTMESVPSNRYPGLHLYTTLLLEI